MLLFSFYFEAPNSLNNSQRNFQTKNTLFENVKGQANIQMRTTKPNVLAKRVEETELYCSEIFHKKPTKQKS